MRIAMIGTGNVGAALGQRFATEHEVVYGNRDPSSRGVRELLGRTPGRASAATLAQAAERADVVVLATPWKAAREALQAAGDLTGKVLVDCINPLKPNLEGLSIGTTTSAAEQVAEWARGARVVKAFNTTGSGNMLDPRFGAQRATMFVCGDDEAAKATVMGLAETIGFEPVDAGALSSARYLEPLAALWINLAYAQGLGVDIAFRLLRR